jgi:hypothetical protein
MLFSLFVIIGNPIIVMIILGLSGYKSRTSFLSGLTVAQISEFSFILIAMGASLGHVDSVVVSIVIIVGVITMTVSTYLILGADRVYLKIGHLLKVFEKKNTKELTVNIEATLVDHAVVVGGGKGGSLLVKYLKRNKIPVLVVDFDPAVFKSFSSDKTNILFGDITDPEIISNANLERARVVISTIPSLSDNLVLAEYIRKLNKRPQLVTTSLTRTDAVKLYEKGVNYVVVPQETAGEYIRHLFKVYGVGSTRLGKMGESHFKRLLQSI